MWPISLQVYSTVVVRLDLLHVGSGRTFLTFFDREFHFVAFGQATIAISDNRGMMHEDIFATGIGGDEAKAL